jgi:hypothetical protein
VQQPETLGAESAFDQAGRPLAFADDRCVQLPRLQRRNKCPRHARADAQLDAWVTLKEDGKGGAQPGCRGDFDGAQPERAGGRPRLPARGRCRITPLRLKPFKVWQEPKAGCGRPDATRKPLEEGDAEFGLERRDARGDCRLHGAQALGGRRHAPGFGNEPNGTQCAKVHAIS